MVNYNRILKSLESEKSDLKRENRMIPSQLSASRKAQTKKENREKISTLSSMQKKIKQKQKSQKEARKKISKFIDKALRAKIQNRKVLKSERMTVKIHSKEIPSVLGDTNRFFKDEMEETKRSMFLR